MIDPTKYGARPISDPAKYGAKPVSPQTVNEKGFPTQEPDEVKRNFAQKLSGFLGIEKAGQGLATTGRVLSGSINQTGNQEAQSLNSIEAIKQKIREEDAPFMSVLSDPNASHEAKNAAIKGLTELHNSDKRKKLVEAINSNNVNAVSQAEIDPGTQLSNKEVLGSFGNVALNTIGVGSLPGEGYATGALSKVPGLTKGASVADKLASTELLSKAGKYAPTLAKAIEGGTLGYGFDVTSGANNNNDNVFTPGIGTLVGTSLPFATKLTGQLLKKGVAFTTGAGDEIIQQALDNPDAVAQATKQYATSPELKQSLVDRAKTAVNLFLHDRSQEFANSISNMSSKTPISKQIVVNEFENQIDKFGGKIKDGQLIFKDSQLTLQDQNNLKKAWSTLSKWSDVTPQGFDRLRQSIGNYMDDFKISGNSRANVVLGATKTALTDSMKNNIEGYADTLANYSKKTQLAKDVLRELNLSGSAKTSTQLNQILRLFKKDPRVVENLTKIMGENEANKLLNDVSGAILSEWLPSGKVANLGKAAAEAALLHFTGPQALLAIPASSPRVVGKTATVTSKAIKKGVGTGLRRAATRVVSGVTE